MKFSTSILLFSAVTALAQVSPLQSISGIHVPSAKTNDKGFLYISGSYSMISDGNPLSIGGFYKDGEGNQVKLNSTTPSNDENAYVSFVPLDNFEFGLDVPVHYDGKVRGRNLDGFSLGDMELTAKWSINAFDWIIFGVSGEILLPTGLKSKGFRPRHSWHIGFDESAYAYTAGNWGVGANMHLSAELNKYLDFNSYVGVLKIHDNKENYILWGAGLNVTPISLVSISLEVSGETPIKMHDVLDYIRESPLRLTPAMRFNLPNYTFLTFSSDIGINYFRDADKYGRDILLKTGHKDMRFKVAGTPDVSIAVSVSKMFNLSWSDSDGDGVIDRKDLCSNTAPGMAVNSRGCPVDEDQDGVMNIVDLCLGTMRGLAVDYNGCPLDLDHDGVYDYLDHCLNTPEGFAVDENGCTLDSDHDGIDDNNDKCPDSRPGEKSDEFGCSIDTDHDGVPNDKDQCPDTPEGISIDEAGCPLDFDKDGVPDDFDKCPDSQPGERVNSLGCPSDMDNDGVPDIRDSCPDTPEGKAVDEVGCRLDQDKDGIYDEDDQCKDTPEGAPVDEKGCPTDSDGDGVPDWADHCMGSLPNVKTDENGCPLNSKLNFNDIAKRVRFKSRDSVLYNSSYTALNDIVAYMREYPIGLMIQCIVDDDFDDTARLARQRMEAILNYITGKGIKKDRIFIQEDKERDDDTNKKGKTGIISLTPVEMQEENLLN